MEPGGSITPVKSSLATGDSFLPYYDAHPGVENEVGLALQGQSGALPGVEVGAALEHEPGLRAQREGVGRGGGEGAVEEERGADA